MKKGFLGIGGIVAVGVAAVVMAGCSCGAEIATRKPGKGGMPFPGV